MSPVSVRSVASKGLIGRWECLNGLEWIVHSGGYENPMAHHAWRIVRRGITMRRSAYAHGTLILKNVPNIAFVGSVRAGLAHRVVHIVVLEGDAG